MPFHIIYMFKFENNGGRSVSRPDLNMHPWPRFHLSGSNTSGTAGCDAEGWAVGNVGGSQARSVVPSHTGCAASVWDAAGVPCITAPLV